MVVMDCCCIVDIFDDRCCYQWILRLQGIGQIQGIQLWLEIYCLLTILVYCYRFEVLEMLSVWERMSMLYLEKVIVGLQIDQLVIVAMK